MQYLSASFRNSSSLDVSGVLVRISWERWWQSGCASLGALAANQHMAQA